MTESSEVKINVKDVSISTEDDRGGGEGDVARSSCVKGAGSNPAEELPSTSMKEILHTMTVKEPTGKGDLPSYEDVTAVTALSEVSSSNGDRPSLRFNNPNAVVGKATCIQIKPTGTEVDVVGENISTNLINLLTDRVNNMNP